MTKGRRVPAYAAPLRDLGQKLLTERGPGYYDVGVFHDDWCAGLRSGDFSRCNCNPEVRRIAPPAKGGRR